MPPAPDTPGQDDASGNGARRRAVGRRRRLTLQRLVTGALEVAHEMGADRMTMKDVAVHLGVGTMSLYHYVPDKAALLTQMAGELYARVDVPPAHAPWEERLRTLLTQVYDGFVRTPGLEPVVQFGEPALSHYGRVADAVLAALSTSGLGRDDAIRAMMVLTGYAANRGAATARRDQLLGTSMAARADIVEQLTNSPHPLIRDVAAEAAEVPHDEVFAFGLDIAIGGIKARVAAGGP